MGLYCCSSHAYPIARVTYTSRLIGTHKIYFALYLPNLFSCQISSSSTYADLPASAGMGLTHSRSCTTLKFLQPNVRRQATFINRDTESVVALTPNIKLAITSLLLLRPGTIRIDATFDLRNPFIVAENHRRNGNRTADNDRADRNQQPA